MSKLTKHIGERIRTNRKRKGYTIEEFSKLINKSKATLSKYENGSIAIDVDTLLDIADALDMQLNHLISYQSSKTSKPVGISNSYFNHSQFYMYFYDGRIKKLTKSILSLSTDIDNSNTIEATLYKGLEDFNNREKCDNIYNGTMDIFDTTSHVTLVNQTNRSEKLHLLLMNPMQRSMPSVGLLAGIGNPPFFSPVAIKIVLSHQPLEEDELFNSVVSISKDELKQYKHYNMMMVGPGNFITLKTKNNQ